MIGLATQDTLAEANDFVDEFGTSFEMLWDESSTSWQTIGVSSQPAAVMLKADGSHLDTWYGAIPEDEVLRLAAENPA